MSFLTADFSISSHFVFKNLALEYFLTLPGDNLKFCERIELVTYGVPELDSGNGVNDVRIQVNGRDITPTVCQGLVAQLAASPTFNSLYAKAMEQWLEYRAAFGVLDSWLADERTAAQELANKTPADLLKKLGDKNNGFNGELDVFNFLYRSIPLNPIDILPALQPSDLNGPLTILVSTGPSHSLNPGTWSPGQTYGHGGIQFTIRGVLKNPLDDVMAQITAAVDNISETVGPSGPIQGILNNIANQTTLIYQRVGSTGPLQTQLSNSKSQLDQMAQTLDLANQELSNVQAALNEIRHIFPSS